jgi:hypothetical protein
MVAGDIFSNFVDLSRICEKVVVPSAFGALARRFSCLKTWHGDRKMRKNASVALLSQKPSLVA